MTITISSGDMDLISDAADAIARSTATGRLSVDEARDKIISLIESAAEDRSDFMPLVKATISKLDG